MSDDSQKPEPPLPRPLPRRNLTAKLDLLKKIHLLEDIARSEALMQKLIEDFRNDDFEKVADKSATMVRIYSKIHEHTVRVRK